MVTSTENVSTEDMEHKLTTQVEYYFGDLNLKHDKFMKYHMNQNEGWFPIDKLMTFNRLKTLTTDQEAVVNCIKKTLSDLIEVSEDGTKMRRSKPVPEESEEYIKDLNQRTLHLKGFPKDALFDDIMEFCRNFGKTEYVQMRRNLKKNNEFKGCIMVTYSAKEDAEKILAEDDVKYKDIVLLKENKEKYFERKKNYYDSLKKKREGKNGTTGELVRTKGAILLISGLNKDTKFADIKEELSKHSKVAFASNVNEQSECQVRFADEDGAKAALNALKTPTEENTNEESEKVAVELCGQKVDISVVSGDEEKEFWREFQNRQSNSSSNNKKNKWQRGKKRPYHDNGNSRNKSAKTEASKE